MYNYVNTGFHDKNIGESGAFRRDMTVPLDKMDMIRDLAGNEQVFRTVWRYPTRDYEEHVERGEALAPLYFDIDNPDLDEAKTSALNLVNQLLEKIPERYVALYFSGNKGFHVEVPPGVFNLREKLPDRKVAYAYKNLAKDLKENHAPDIDLAVYEPKRLWRLVNSRHEKTGLYKIPITPSELELLTADEIKDLAENPRKDIYLDRDADPVKEMQDLYEECRGQDPRNSIPSPEGEVRTDMEPIIDDETPCIESLLQGVKKGERNEAAIRLASTYKNFGHSQKKTEQELEHWNTRNTPPLPTHEIKNTIRSAYQNQYNYGCQDHLLEKYCNKDRCTAIDND